MKYLMLSILMILLLTACSSQVQTVATRTEVLEQKLPKSATEPWFKQKESDDITGAGSLDLILVLRGELEKARMQLEFIRENYIEK